MVVKYKNKTIQINVPFSGYTVGQKVTISMKNGVPASPFWKNRLKDSKIDNCIEFVEKKKESKPITAPKKHKENQ